MLDTPYKINECTMRKSRTQATGKQTSKRAWCTSYRTNECTTRSRTQATGKQTTNVPGVPLSRGSSRVLTVLVVFPAVDFPGVFHGSMRRLEGIQSGLQMRTLAALRVRRLFRWGCLLHACRLGWKVGCVTQLTSIRLVIGVDRLECA